MSDFICENCNHTYKGHDNLFGKVCVHCNHYNPPVKEMTIVRKNRVANESVTLTILEYLKKKYGENNANPSK